MLRASWRHLAALLVGLIGCGPAAVVPPTTIPPLALSRHEPRLASLREAALRWGVRPGPTRAVVDQVVLVPDLPTFLRAIRGWNRERFYPILIETDVAATLRFLRAFRPAQVVRLAQSAATPPTADALWRVARASVAASWAKPSEGEGDGGDASKGDGEPNGARDRDAIRPDDLVGDGRPPADLGSTLPGVVVAHPEAPMLAGAVALAAGHFEPLVRFDGVRGFHRTLTLDEFRAFDQGLTGAVRAAVASQLGLGDDCDFVTVAGDYPYRYRDEAGADEAVDDGIARDPATARRWAFTGRLLGDPALSVARAMAALFLQPESALLFNGYDDAAQPWSLYATRTPARRLADHLPTRQQSGPELGTVAAWAEAFDPENRAGLVWVNSHGTPTVFHLRNQPATVPEIPRSVPTAVVMVHSYSAADPTDPGTIAGRWLANGAFVYFGSINEPYLQAFRTPDLALDLALEGIPLAACLRATAEEPYGSPWRLVYLGDPLYTLQRRPGAGRSPKADRRGRLTPPHLPASHQLVARADRTPPLPPPPAAEPTEPLVTTWDRAIAATIQPGDDPANPTLLDAIAQTRGIDRNRLTPPDRVRLDLIRSDLLFQGQRRGELRSVIASIPQAERSPTIRHWHETLQATDLAWLLSGSDFDRVLRAWDQLIGSDAPAPYQAHATARVGALATSSDLQQRWTKALRRALGRPLAPEVAAALHHELDRVAPPTPAVTSSR